MSRPESDISDEARALYLQLQQESGDLPVREALGNYRDELRTGSEANVQAALGVFDGSVEKLEIAGIECCQVTPQGWSEAQGLCILYAYGGGYVSGSTWEDLVIAVPLAAHSAARVVMVEYCLSPEHPYPLPQQDMREVYAALLERYTADRLIVSGESAGGHQALGLMQYARDRGLALPRSAALFSPWCDLANEGDSHLFNEGRDPTLDNAWVDQAAAWHAAGEALDDAGISPIHGDMRGLPPCIITTGSRDLLLSQCLRLAQKLHTAGVDCDLRVWEGLWHVFEFYPIPEAQASIIEVAEFIRRH